jgi:hypothetical protein
MARAPNCRRTARRRAAGGHRCPDACRSARRTRCDTNCRSLAARCRAAPTADGQRRARRAGACWGGRLFWSGEPGTGSSSGASRRAMHRCDDGPRSAHDPAQSHSRLGTAVAVAPVAWQGAAPAARHRAPDRTRVLDPSRLPARRRHHHRPGVEGAAEAVVAQLPGPWAGGRAPARSHAARTRARAPPESTVFREVIERTFRRLPGLGRQFGIRYDRRTGLTPAQRRTLAENAVVVAIELQ